MAYQVTERLYVDKDDKVYTEDQLNERSEVRLLMSAGGELTDEEAKRYGLTSKPARAKAGDAVEAPAGEADLVEPDATAKAMAGPPATKAATAKADK